MGHMDTMAFAVSCNEAVRCCEAALKLWAVQGVYRWVLRGRRDIIGMSSSSWRRRGPLYGLLRASKNRCSARNELQMYMPASSELCIRCVQ